MGSAAKVGMNPPDVVALLDLDRLVFMSFDDSAIQDEDDIVFSGLLLNGLDHRLILLRFTDPFDHLDELCPFRKLMLLTVDGRLHLSF